MTWMPDAHIPESVEADAVVPWPQTFGARPLACPRCVRGNPHWRTLHTIRHYPALHQSADVHEYECLECGHLWTHRYT